MEHTTYPDRKGIRLKNYDYSQAGAYFITICTKNKENILSRITSDSDGLPVIELTEYGKIVDTHIRLIPGNEKYVIMPNHVHLLIVKNGAMWASLPTNISNDIRSFKTVVTKKIGISIWQTSFYDHIIRCEADYLEIWKYIDENPIKWVLDTYYRQ